MMAKKKNAMSKKDLTSGMKCIILYVMNLLSSFRLKTHKGNKIV